MVSKVDHTTWQDLGVNGRRARVQVLDKCLDALKSANAEGVVGVSESIARKYSRFVRGLSVGVAITAALDLVFREQQVYLRGETETSSAKGRAPIGPHEARRLSDQIKSHSRDMSLLLLEAHDRRAWLALGYRTWDEYVRLDLGFSRSRAYELLDHARILLAVMSAGNLSETPAISPYAARQLKPHLGSVVTTIRDRGADRTPSGVAAETVNSVVNEALQRVSSPRSPAGPRLHVGNAASDLELLHQALETIGSIRSTPADMAKEPEVAELIDSVSAAGKWLVTLGRELSSSWSAA